MDDTSPQPPPSARSLGAPSNPAYLLDPKYPQDFWHYLSVPQQDLLIEGDYLKDQIIEDSEYSFKDYSFLVFPFAKAYEGFLKQVFLDVKFISHLDYISNHFRLGKMLSPFLVKQLGQRSLYTQITRVSSRQFAESIWHTWKIHRNEIFHYYPHNVKAITFSEADSITKEITTTMKVVYRKLLLTIAPNPPWRGKVAQDEADVDNWKL
jgi:hypothetical protein